jgi:hypothetical protein
VRPDRGPLERVRVGGAHRSGRDAGSGPRPGWRWRRPCHELAGTTGPALIRGAARPRRPGRRQT